jgi:hypothetical protein
MKTAVFDFDGVIHSYTSGWKGATVIPDPPVPGIGAAIAEIRKDYKVVVVSTRSETDEGREAIAEWLDHWDIFVDGISATKPPAVVYVDDRAIQFDGNSKELYQKISTFKTWQEKEF